MNTFRIAGRINADWIKRLPEHEGEIEIHERLSRQMMSTKGGPGSGHHGHAGRPGKRGGSSPGTASKYGMGTRPDEQGHINKEKLSRYLDSFIGETERGDPTEVVGDSWRRASMDDRIAVKERVVNTLTERIAGDPETTPLPDDPNPDVEDPWNKTYDDVNDFVKQWSHSSNDEDMRSLAIQRDAAREFGVPLSEFTQRRIDEQEDYELREWQREWEGEGFQKKVDETIIKSRFFPPDNPNYNMTKREAEEWVRGTMPSKPSPGTPPPLLPSSQQRRILREMYNETQSQLRSQGIGPDDHIVLFRGVSLPKETAGQWKNGTLAQIKGNAIESWSLSSTIALDFARGNAGESTGVVFAMSVPAKMILSTCTSGFGCLTEGEVTILGSGGEAEVWYSTSEEGV